MSDGAPRSVSRLLAQGLDHMAAGERNQAVECWLQVLAIAPNHEAALDYLAQMGESPTPALAVQDDGPDSDAAGPGCQPPAELDAEELREEALELLSGGLVDDAYQLLTTTSMDVASELESLALIELLRTHLVDDVIMRVGSVSSVPIVEVAGEELMKFNLPPGAGFLISRIDGQTPVEDLVAVSGMDPFETYHTLGRLLESGIVGVRD